MAVIGRPAGRYLAHELRGDRAAPARTEQDAEPAVPGHLGLALAQVSRHRLSGFRPSGSPPRGFRRAGARGSGVRRGAAFRAARFSRRAGQGNRVKMEVGAAVRAEPVRSAGRQPYRAVAGERQDGMPIDVQVSSSVDHEPQLARASGGPAVPGSRWDIDEPPDELRPG
jgi:hypothetical protein